MRSGAGILLFRGPSNVVGPGVAGVRVLVGVAGRSSRSLPKSARITKILSVFSRLSSTYWSSLVAGLAALPFLAAAVRVVPTFTTLLAPRCCTVPLPLSRLVIACSRRACFFSSAGLGRASLCAWSGWDASPDTLLTCGAALAVVAGMPRVVPSPAATTRLNSPADFFRTVPPSTAIVSREGAPEKEHRAVPSREVRLASAEGVHVVETTCRGRPELGLDARLRFAVARSSHGSHGTHKGRNADPGIMFVRCMFAQSSCRDLRLSPVRLRS